MNQTSYCPYHPLYACATSSTISSTQINPVVLKVGRYVVATRDILPMELILIDEPGVFGPNHDTRPACLECLLPVATDGSAPLCDKCGLPLCNSDKCRSSEQTWHSRLECQLFQEPTPSGFKFRVKMDRPQWVIFYMPFRMTSIQGRVEYVRLFSVWKARIISSRLNMDALPRWECSS